MEDPTTFLDETTTVNPNHGWQKVSYARKNNKKTQQQNKAKLANGTVAGGGGSKEKNVFKAIEEQAEDRHRRIVEEKAKRVSAIDDDEEGYNGKKGRSKRRGDEGESDESGDESEEREGSGGLKEGEGEDKKKKEKKKKEKKVKVSVAEAAVKIDCDELAAFLAEITGSYEGQEDIQLMRFGDFFGRKFSGVGSAQFPWVKTLRESPVSKITEIPLSQIPDAVYKTSVDWINNRSVTALHSFALLLLDSILSDLSNQVASAKHAKKAPQQSSKSQVAMFVVLAMVLRRKPDVFISILPTLRENPKYQGQDKLPAIIWMISQVCQGDLAVGLYAWAHHLLPMLNSKSSNNPLTRDLILQLIERILAGPKARTILVNGAVRKGERLIPPAELEILLRVTFPVSSARMKVTERFEAVYPTLKEVALAGVPGSKAMKQVTQQIFGFAITAAGESNAELSKEATSIALWCLTQSADIYKLWDKVYQDNLEASVSILKKLSEELRGQNLSQSSLEVVKQTMRSFQEKNEKALAGDNATQHAILKDADKFSKQILGRLSRGHGCLKAFAVLLIAAGVGLTVMSPNIESLDWKTLDWKRLSVMLSSFPSA